MLALACVPCARASPYPKAGFPIINTCSSFKSIRMNILQTVLDAIQGPMYPHVEECEKPVNKHQTPSTMLCLFGLYCYTSNFLFTIISLPNCCASLAGC